MLSVTLIIIILTCIVSISAFNSRKITNDLIFYPPAISQQNQWYRIFSCALIHAGWIHLFFNMWVLYTFGNELENNFITMFGAKGKLFYILFYVIAQAIALLPTYYQHKDDSYYRSLGASGAVSAVLFAFIILSPLTPLMIFPIPIPMPAFIFGVLYLALAMYMAKRGGDNINHSAHFWGAAAGVILLLIFCYAFSPYDPVAHFISEIRQYTGL